MGTRPQHSLGLKEAMEVDCKLAHLLGISQRLFSGFECTGSLRCPTTVFHPKGGGGGS